MQLKFGSIDTFDILLGDFFEKRGIPDPQTTVTAISFAVKASATDLDANILAEATLANGGVAWKDNKTLAVKFQYTDYGVGKMVVGGTYVSGLGFKTATWTQWFEADLKDSEIKVIQDFFRS